MQVTLGGDGATSWAINNLAPGDTGTKTVTVTNNGSGAGTLNIWLSNITGTEGTPPGVYGTTPYPPSSGDLINDLVLQVTGTVLHSSFTMPAPLSEFPTSADSPGFLMIDTLGAGEIATLIWSWGLPPATGNNAQGDSVSFDINYSLTELPPATPPGGGGGGGGSIPVESPSPTPTRPAVPTTTPIEPTPTSGTPGGDGHTRTIELDVPDNSDTSGVTDAGVVIGTLASTTPDKRFSLSILDGTQVYISNEGRQENLPDKLQGLIVPTRIVVVERTLDIPPYPEGWVPVSPAYDINGETDGILHGVRMDKPTVMVIDYDEDLLPLFVAGLSIFYYDYENGWTQLDPPAGIVAEAGQAAAEVNHFSLFVVLAKPGDAAKPVLPAQLSIQRLRVNPTHIMVGLSSDVRVNVSNTGGMPGEYSVTVKVNGQIQKTQDVKLKAGQTQEVDLILAPGIAGTYTIQVGDLTQYLIVDPGIIPDLSETDYWWLLLIAVGIATLAFLPFSRRKGERVS